jgi:uncharacterized protein YjiK/phosphodiesterase/alkaline phosphatase D-like protein/arylsulfatase A-like enzyme
MARNIIIFVADGLRPGSVNATDTPTLYSIRQNGVNFTNSHSLFPTFTTPNASAIATGHYLGDTGDFSNTVYTGYPVINANGTVTPFIENDPILADINANSNLADPDLGFNRNNFLTEESLLAYARLNGYSTAAIGKLGPVAIFDVTQDTRTGGTTTPNITPKTVILDDSTYINTVANATNPPVNGVGSQSAIPLSQAIATSLNNAGLIGQNAPGTTTVATTIGSIRNNQSSGTLTTAGTLNSNAQQQQFFADATTKAVLPQFVADITNKTSQGFAAVYWSRDPDGTQHNNGDAFNAADPGNNSLTIGISGPTAKKGVQDADANLKQIIDYLKATPDPANPGKTLYDNTDIFVTADHGFSTISRQAVGIKNFDANGVPTYINTTSYASTLSYYTVDATTGVKTPTVHAGFLPPGFVAIDLAKDLGATLYDPNKPTATVTTANINNIQYSVVDPTAGQNPLSGNGVIGGNGKVVNGVIDPNTQVVVAANGGSDLLYVPSKDKTLVAKIVSFLAQKDYISGIFTDDAFGDIPGALKLSTIGLQGTAELPTPSIVINFKTFSTNPNDPNDPQAQVEVADTTLQQGQGMHGSFGRGDTFNNMAAIGPDFKSGYVDNAPVSNADVVPTLTKILGWTLPSVGTLTGRAITEALVNGPASASVTSATLTSAPVNGQLTTLKTQSVGNTTYFDVAGFAGGTDGLALNNVDLSTYIRVGRYDLPEPKRTSAPANSVLAQEVSAVTYNSDTDTLFVVGDGGTSIVQVSKTGKLIDSMTLAPGSSPQGTDFYDPEGLTYIGGGKFVLIEERDRQANLFTYTPGTTLTKSNVQTVKLGTTVGNIGIEGISWDPQTNGFIAVKETQPEGIFQTTINFAAGTASNGSPTTVNSTDLFDPAKAGLLDFADVYALSNLSSLSGRPDSSHLLILSQESGKIVNIDRSGNISSSLTIVADPGNPLSVVDQQHEGLTMDNNGFLYVVSENGGGSVDFPQLWVYAPSSVVNQAPTAVVLNNKVSTIAENTSTTTRIKVADIAITDDGLGTNNLTVAGTDAKFFEADSTGLYIKAGTTLDYETKTSYSIVVNVDDATLGNTPDAIAPFTLAVSDIVNETPTPPTTSSILITEVAPWSSGNSPYAADWFEVTNTGTSSVDITGWKIDDNSNSFASSVALNGVTSIAAGQSVIFIESATPSTTISSFETAWFGSNVPKGFTIGTYSGSGVGLSTGGDAVNLFDASGNRVTGISFGTSTTGFTFDNKAGLGSTTLPLPTVSTLSATKVNGAFIGANTLEIGSPGTITSLPSLSFSGVAAGDATSNDAILWTRIFDPLTKKALNTNLTAQVSTDANFSTLAFTYNVPARTDGLDHDGTLKVDATGLKNGTKYYYRFVAASGDVSNVGAVKTAPDANTQTAVRFGFSGDADGLMRPYSSTQNFGSLNLDFFGFLGDTIYETASNGSPAAANPVTNPTQALIDYHRKYLENIQPVNNGGFSSLQTLYSSQGNYTLLDNHELGNKQIINGGAPSALATVTNPSNGSSNTIDDVNRTGTFINQTVAFKTLEQAYSDYQPIKEQIITAPNDIRTNGTQQLYGAHQWGENLVYINTDTRSYRDVRLKTAAGADDTGARADNPDRTLLGKTQLAWLKQTLLDAQKNGTIWKFVAVSDPIDQIGAIGSGDDGGKSWIGGYRAERNDLLKFIADNGIKNVVFLATDDHLNRINELTYFDNINDPTSVKVLPNALSVVDGPIGATQVSTPSQVIEDHSFANIKSLADALATKQKNAGVNPIGLDPNFAGLKNVVREGDPNANTLRQAVDFYSPDTFNYTIFDISADGKTLNVNVQGVNSTGINTFPEPSPANPVRSILSFSLDAAPSVLSVAASTTTATEADGTPGVFTVTSDAKANTDLTFNYTVGGTATNGVDYTKLTGTATIAAGQSSVDIAVKPVDDGVAEGNESVFLSLTSGSGYSTNATKSAATVTIIDNGTTPVGTTGDDSLFAIPGSKFDGQSNIVFTGAGNDEVDLSTNSSVARNNRIDLGSGNDIIYVSQSDRVFGSNGNDTFDATEGKGGNRMSGGAGNDVFFLGSNDRALGGDGNDLFYVQSGGNNLISGGAGNDKFFIVNAELPNAPNTIVDFQVGIDVIGVNGAASLGITTSTLKLNQVGVDTAIVFNNQTLAVLSGIQASNLSLTNTNQFVLV